MSDGTQSLTMAEALAEARTEMSPASDVATEPAVPAAEVDVPNLDEQAPVVEGEQPAADVDGFSVDASGLEEALLDTVEDSQNGSGSGIVPGSDDFWNLEVEVQTVNGSETVSVKDLTDGYLRQADYTRKTQAVAEESKRLEKANEFLGAFEEDPASFIRSLAVQAGFISEDQAPVKDVPIAKIPTQEELTAQVDALVEERVKDDPRVKAAEMSDARNQVNTEFDRLQKEYNVELSPELRDSLIVEATKRGTADLESLLTRRILLAQQKQSTASNSNLASTSRPGVPPASATQAGNAQEGENPSMREAWQQAKVAAAQQ